MRSQSPAPTQSGRMRSDPKSWRPREISDPSRLHRESKPMLSPGLRSRGLSMNIDLNTAATIATLIVITVTAVAAYVQLRHMRTANQLEALLTVLARIEHADFGRMVDGARATLAERLPDPAFRRNLEEGNVERTNNPWLNLGNSYEWVGSLVRT